MKFAKVFRNRQEYWPRISFVLSIGFLALSVVLLILGNRLLEDSRNHILEQRRIIAQMVANQIDHSLGRTIRELERTLRLADIDPSDPDLDVEAQALAELYFQPELSFSQIILLDSLGNVVLAHPSSHFTPGTNLSDYLDLSQALDGSDVHVSIPRQDPPNESLATAITIPIYNQDRFLGWLSGLVVLDLSGIKTSLEEAVVLDHTAHGILVDSQGRSLVSTFDLPFLSPGEHYSYYRQAIVQGQPVVEVVPFELDLPGEPAGHLHVMAFVPLQSVLWGVSIGGDTVKETFAGSYRLFIWLASLFVISGIVIWGATLFSTKKLLEPVRNVNLKFGISRQIAKAKDWEELASLIVRIPSTFAPVSGARLLSHDRDSEFELVSEWRADRRSPACLEPSQSLEICEACVLNNDATLHSHVLNDLRPENLSTEPCNSYCLPLVHQEHLVGTLQFWLPSSEPLSKQQIDILTSVSSDMAIAVESAQLQRSNLKQIEITQAEQRRIFRRLHDTLGQNIAFLRLKLDQYSSADSLVSIPEIQEDIEQMRDIAKEASDQLRNMLVDLHPETQSDLAIALRARASSVAERANYQYELTVEGRPAKMPQHIKRHVLFICYEALNNIEQHAYAQNVIIHLRWGRDDLAITIKDDGTGFDLEGPSSGDHFGLEIMQERAQTINGRLALTSSPNKGTEVTLWVPLRPSSESWDGGLN